MLTLAIIISLTMLGLLVVLELAIVGRFLAINRRPAAPTPPDDELPRVTVFMPLRGADPTLAAALPRLLKQDYPDYEVHIVIDGVDDPAWEVVQSVVDAVGAKNVRIEALTDRRETCSLKCSALLQMWESIDPRSEVIVLADGDLAAHPRLLRDLVAPLVDSTVGAAFGNRWFAPSEGYFGSVVRALWNIGSIVPMDLFGIPWGGCLAIKCSAMRTSNIADKWSRSIVDDTPVAEAMHDQQLKVQFVPGLMIPIREECRLGFALQFISRQLAWTLLYVEHSIWTTLLPSLVIVAFPFFILATLVAAVVTRHPGTLALSLGIAGYAAWVGVLIFVLERTVRRSIAAHGERLAPMTWRYLLSIPLGVVAAVVVHEIAVVRACFMRQVVWRGVTYQIRGPWDVRLVEYQPFSRPPELAESKLSI